MSNNIFERHSREKVIVSNDQFDEAFGAMSQRCKFEFCYLSSVVEAQQTGIGIGIGIGLRLEYSVSVSVAKRGIVLTLMLRPTDGCSTEWDYRQPQLTQFLP